MIAKTPVPPILKSARLTLEPLSHRAHYGGMRRMAADPEVMRFLRGVETPLQTRQFIERTEARWRSQGLSWWALIADDGMVGAAALQHIAGVEDAPIEVGWRLARAAFGQGFATEAGQTLLAHARSLGIEQVLAVTDPGNSASERVMQRLGMHRLGLQIHYDRPCLTYAINLMDAT